MPNFVPENHESYRNRDLIGAALEMYEALKKIAEMKGQCIYSIRQDFREGSNAAYEELAAIAIKALAKADGK